MAEAAGITGLGRITIGRNAVTIGGTARKLLSWNVLDIEGALLTHAHTQHPTPRNQKTSPGAVCGEPKSKLAFLTWHCFESMIPT